MREDSRKRQRRKTGYLCVFFLAVIVLLGLIGSSQILFVFFLYLSIILEALSLSVFIALSENSWGKGRSLEDVLFMREPTGAVPSTAFREGSDAVNSLYIYVKYASRGSDYSKREVASVLRSIFQNSPHFEEEEKLRFGH